MAAIRCAVLSVLLLAGVAGADEFSDFRIPEHRWRSIRGDASFSGSRNRMNEAFSQRTNDNGSLRLEGSGSWAYEADDRQWLVSSFAEVIGRQSNSEDRARFFGATSVLTDDLDSRIEEARELLGLSGEFQRYPESTPLGLKARMLAVGYFGQGWSDSRHDQFSSDVIGSARSLQEVDSRQDSYMYQAELAASMGIGRVRNATGVYSAELLERRLRGDGAITGPLSAAARERIARLYYVGPQYRSAHDRPDKFFWRDLEIILRDEGALAAGNLDAYALLHALEPYVPGAIATPLRRSGYWVAASITYDHQHAIRRTSGASHDEDYVDGVLVSSTTFSVGSRFTDHVDRVLFGPEAQWCLPLGWRWQIDVDAFLRFDIVDPSQGTILSQLRASYVIAERWGASARVAHRRETVGDDLTLWEGWFFTAGIDVVYDIEDHLQAVLSIADQQSHFDGSDTFSRNQRVSLGLSYLFSGGLDAPGLIDPVRPLRGGTLNP
jgi:hypothetical protein